MVKLSVLSAAETLAEMLVWDAASDGEGGCVNEAFGDGRGAGGWAGGDAGGVWDDGRAIAPVAAWAGAASLLRLHSLRHKPSATTSIVAARIPLFRIR